MGLISGLGKKNWSNTYITRYMVFLEFRHNRKKDRTEERIAPLIGSC
ncbi:hypothetical protein F383_32393 [Gossypium arboreum]|uniref:Uncharacterized protein n=1 Tax=Gossypium arboreum TaxID=29729 RepID=A0A0B0N5B1_GOSAR|nr:hypothetical protein F383_32393 [Gossypium arboreum]